MPAFPLYARSIARMPRPKHPKNVTVQKMHLHENTSLPGPVLRHRVTVAAGLVSEGKQASNAFFKHGFGADQADNQVAFGGEIVEMAGMNVNVF